jgi:hypothetical protein
MDAEDDEEDAQHLQKEYLSDQLQLAKDRGNTEAAELFEKQLAALAPAAEEDRVKDARLLSNRLCTRAAHLNSVVTKLQNVAAENRTRLVTLEVERTSALDAITEEFYRKIAEYTHTYDEGIAEATAAVEKAEADILSEKALHAVEDQRLKDAVTHALGTKPPKRGRWADAAIAEEQQAGDDEDSDLEGPEDLPEVPVHTVLAVDTSATAPAINQALGLSGDKMLTPELIGSILQAHLKAAEELQAAADIIRQAEHVAEHTARLDAARIQASAERDARHAERVKASAVEEEQAEAEELNGNTRRARPSKTRERSRTPPNNQEELPLPPLPPAQPVTGSATVVACAVMVKSKTTKNQEKKAAKKAKKQSK